MRHRHAARRRATRELNYIAFLNLFNVCLLHLGLHLGLELVDKPKLVGVGRCLMLMLVKNALGFGEHADNLVNRILAEVIAEYDAHRAGEQPSTFGHKALRQDFRNRAMRVGTYPFARHRG